MTAVVGRYAPSPTGALHLGNLRTALIAWLSARSAGGRFLLRIEDLDSTRAKEEWIGVQESELRAIDLDWDGEPIRQSERGSHYSVALDQLSELGLLYECFCSRKEVREAASAPHPDPDLPADAYPGTCRNLTDAERDQRRQSGRPPALRVRTDGARVAFRDLIHGEHEVVLDDFVVRRNDGDYAYNLAVVVDDAAQGVNEVVRGEDLLDSTARQLWLYRALELSPPAEWLHLPLMRGSDGDRLTKRHGSVTLEQVEAEGGSTSEVVGSLAASIGLAPEGTSCLAPDLLGDFSREALIEGCERAMDERWS
ncbi:MAG: tRNA glutamyl-Q(34) synthetase GluQRS [Solirubrobacterales bacterium]